LWKKSEKKLKKEQYSLTMKNPVRTTTAFVVERAKNVFIDNDKIKEAVLEQNWSGIKNDFSVLPLNMDLKGLNEEQSLDYLIVLDSLNFCFWNKNRKWFIKYKGKRYSGYYGLAVALKKFFEENIEKANLNYFSDISFKEFKEIFSGGKNLLLLKKRHQIVRMVARKMLKKFGNSRSFIEGAKNKFSLLLPKIYKELPYFNDVAYYKGRKIYFLKRAQILCADIFCLFKGKGIGRFDDLDYLTCFPDYKLPQILNQMGIIRYSKNLKKKIIKGSFIKSGSVEEVEIRSAVIWAVENLAKELKKQGLDVYPFEIDWFLWNKSKKEKMKLPHHLTKTIYY